MPRSRATSMIVHSAAAGGLTDEDDINLGDPIWKRNGDDDDNDDDDDGNLF
jgi:hypothetical protein